MTTITDEDIERILRTKNADLGLFILAMHSLMERTLKEKIDPNKDFDPLMKDYIANYEIQFGTPIPYSDKYYLPQDKHKICQTLKETRRNHFLSNAVRHTFKTCTEEEARSTVVCFLNFAAVEGWTKLKTIKKLEAELDNWKNHSNYISPEFQRAINEIEKLKSENDNLAKKANELTELQKKLEVITAHEKLLQSELAESEARLSKKDEKLDKVRQNANEQYMKFKKEKEEIEAKIKDYENTKKYVEYLEKVSFCTKTRHDYEKSIITLSREQSDVLNQINMNKDYLVKGAAGTGKSLVLVKTLEKSVNMLNSELNFEETANSFRLMTYAKSLVKYNQYVTKLLEAEVPENSITTADFFILTVLRTFYPEKSFVYDFNKLPEGVFEDGDFTAIQVFNEAQEYVWANCITKEQYVDEVCEREGMKIPIKKPDRQKMWTAIEKAEAKLEGLKAWPRNYAAKKILELIGQDGDKIKDLLSEYSFVDEAQDLPPVVLAVIKQTTKRAVFLAGDSDQSIYRRGFNWTKSGIDIVGRTKILKTNFRNTKQIHDYAEEYRSLFKTMDKTTMPEAFRPGPPVEHVVAKNTDDAMNQMVEQVKLLMNALNYAEENICIIANRKSKLETMQKLLDKSLGVEANIINDEFDFEKTQGIRLCTMQNSKGLDFPVVLFLADHRIYGAEDGSAYDQETFMTQQFNMVYVVLTRAMEMLYVYTVKGSEYEPFSRLK